MKWVSAISTRPSLEAAVDEVVNRAQQALGKRADLALVFISVTFASEYPRLLPLLRERLNVAHIIGCGGGGVIGQTRTGEISEIEGEPALCLTLAHLPEVQIHAFHTEAEDLPSPDCAPQQWVDLLQIDPAAQPHFILLADVQTSSITELLQGLDYAYPQSVKIGGLSSGLSSMEGSGLFCDQRLYQEGAIGVALTGNVEVETIVAQGCRPIGHPYRVADADRNVLLQVEEQLSTLAEINGVSGDPRVQTPLTALQDLVGSMSDADRELAQNALSVGIVRDEFKQDLEPGDFLIRNLIGVDPRIGAVAIGDRIRPGQRIQFHLRDAQASITDLETLLQHYQKGTPQGANPPAGALMFACLGRGQQFYKQPNVDSTLFHRYVHNIPIGGFFCNGEIGPIGGTTFVHGYTSAFAIFRQQTSTR